MFGLSSPGWFRASRIVTEIVKSSYFTANFTLTFIFLPFYPDNDVIFNLLQRWSYDFSAVLEEDGWEVYDGDFRQWLDELLQWCWELLLVSRTATPWCDQEAASYRRECSDGGSICAGGHGLNTAVSGCALRCQFSWWKRPHQCSLRCSLLLGETNRTLFLFFAIGYLLSHSINRKLINYNFNVL